MRRLHQYGAIAAIAFAFLVRSARGFLIVPYSTPPNPPTALLSAQLLEFEERETGVKIILIGAMHYNPESVKLAKDTIEQLGKANRLGSVIVEACDIRWNKTAELYAEKPMLKRLLTNEMRVACDTAMEYNRPVVLGDQRINITVAALKGSLRQTILDIVTPPSGWSRFIAEVSTAWDETVPLGGQGFLSAFAFLDPRLLLALPVSLIKYPLSYCVRDPVPTSLGLTILAALSFLDDPTTIEALLCDNCISFSDWVLSFGLAFLETAVFARLLLKPLLAERNEVLAKNILNQCRLYSSKPQLASPFEWFRFSTEAKALERFDKMTVYAPGSASNSSRRWTR